MPVKIRLQRKGRKKRPFYYIVVADSRAPRDGKFIQKIGTYNPLTVPATVHLDRNRALHWLQKGAVPTDTVRRILSYKGVLYLKHLLRGVKLGLFDEKVAMEKFDQWNIEQEGRVMKKREGHKKADEVEAGKTEAKANEAVEEKAPAPEEVKEEAVTPKEEVVEEPVEQKAEEPAAKEEKSEEADAPKEEKSEEEVGS